MCIADIIRRIAGASRAGGRECEDAEKLAAHKAAVDEGLASGVSDLTFTDIVKESRDSLAHN